MRWSLYGWSGAAIAHWVIASQGLVVARPIWLIYLYVGFAVPAWLVLALFVNMCIPRNITIKPTQIMLRSGQTARAIPFELLLRWSIVLSKASPGQTLLLLRYQDARGRRRRALIGVGSTTDLLQLDRTMRARHRLGQHQKTGHRMLQTPGAE